MALAFLRYGLPRRPFARLASLPLGGSPLDRATAPVSGVVGDLGPDDDLVVAGSSRALLIRRSGTRCRVSLWLLEPPSIQGRLYRVLPWACGRFDAVLTHQASLASRCRNALLVPHGGSWIDRELNPLSDRTGRISLIASAKASTEGHRLRHRIVAWSRDAAPDLACLGRGYRPIPCKSEGHLPFMYSVVIENGSYPGYFTEKLVDCMLCGSVPIYWGDPEFARHFDPSGVIFCRSEDELRRAIVSADLAGFEARSGARQRNAEAARRFARPETMVAAALASRFGAPPPGAVRPRAKV